MRRNCATFGGTTRTALWLVIKMRADTETKGKTLPFVDGQIAAIAIANGLILVTRNSKDFAGIASLQLENWFV